jgi:hypothetical protein
MHRASTEQNGSGRVIRDLKGFSGANEATGNEGVGV